MNLRQNIPQQAPPSLEKLRTLLLNGTDFVSTTKELIDRFNLPYLIIEVEGWEEDKDRWTVKNKLTIGEQFLSRFITVDGDTIQMKKYAALMASTPHSVLVTGDTGTGKELIGRSMIGSRSGAIKTINCAGIPEQLMESILFGHLKGAFTGADTTRDGLITAADNGVMFLDEVGELPLQMQAKLLRVLQEKTIMKVGSVKEEQVNCKFVFATNRDLKSMVEKSMFKKDLFARLSTLELHIKPLWPDRKCDLVPIVQSMEGGDEFLKKYQAPLELGALDLSFNVRSLEQHVIRFNVLGNVLMSQ